MGFRRARRAAVQSAYKKFAFPKSDRLLDGKYEMFIVASLKDQSLIDVLFVTDEGWLRHSTSEEFQERQHISEKNRKGLEDLDNTIRDALRKANEDLNK